MLTELTTLTLTNCPICHSHKTELILTHPDAFIDLLHLHQCQDCSVIFLSPQLTPESIVILEESSTVYDYSDEEIEHEVSWRMGIIRQLEQLTTHLIKKPGRLLDIGCNRGLLLESARRGGWEPVGVEISSVAADRARQQFGLEVYPDLEAIWELEPFDVVVAWHVLEHTLNPVAFLRQAAALLKPAGIIALQVPSFDFREEWEQRNQAGSLLCAVHNFYFTDANIRSVLSRAGLTALWIDNNPQGLMLTVFCTRTMSEMPQASQEHLHQMIQQLESTLTLVQQQATSWCTRAEELDGIVAAKNNHIAHLEGLIRRLENGRAMRLLRRFAR